MRYFISVLSILITFCFYNAIAFRSRMIPAYRLMSSKSSTVTINPSVIPIEQIPLNLEGQKTSNSLVVFVVDTSMPHSQARIQSVTGCALDMMPKLKTSVISCNNGGAIITLEPTSSSILARRRLLKLKPSVMGNLGHGIAMALSLIKSSFESGNINDVTLAIIGDSRAQGLLASTSSAECEADLFKDICDVELQEDAVYLNELFESIKSFKLNLKCVVIDTGKQAGDDSDDSQGARFAKQVNSKYHYMPDLSPQNLYRTLMN